jgi:SAM-dependent methyltransferase
VDDETRAMAVLFELHEEVPQQGPGDDGITREVLRMLPPFDEGAAILDVGCGSGRSTLVLARETRARITAVDVHPAFVERLRREAAARGFGDRVQAVVGDMAALDLPAESLDLIWSEGAIYIIGLATGLRAWRPLLKRGGYVALSEIAWLIPDVPAECREYFAREYPAITTVEDNLEIIAGCGYRPLAHRVLPESAWWSYYDPLSARVEELWPRYEGDPVGRAVLEGTRAEIEMYRRHAAAYGYVFYVLERAES